MVIETTYVKASMHAGARVRATNGQVKVTVMWDQSLPLADNHARAASILLKEIGSDRACIGGERLRGNGYVFVTITGGLKAAAHLVQREGE